MNPNEISEFLYTKALKRCKKKKRKFYLTIDDIKKQLLKLKYKDYYTGLIPDNWHSYSIDRVDSNKDYQPDNIVITTVVINTMKCHQTLELFYNNVKLIYEKSRP